MGLFTKKKIAICSPIAGEVVSLEMVSDPVFSSEMLGKGFAVIPSQGRVYAPISGKAVTVFPTKHAIGLIDNDGVEVLVHIGLDTVKLNGQHFTSHIMAGEEVRVGQLLAEFDMNEVMKAGYEVITPVIVTNSPVFKEMNMLKTGQVEIGEEIIHIKK